MPNLTRPSRAIELKLTAFILVLALVSSANADYAYLSERNTEVPFSYLTGDVRSWPFLERELPPGSRVSFLARRDGEVLAEGHELNFSGLSVSLNPNEMLEIISQPEMSPVTFSLEVSIELPDGQHENQQLSVRPAPPPRPISYLADFGDDLIRIFMDSRDGHWRPITKTAFDQYFRRCQAHGVHRLILWQSPFPYICDPANYASEDWDRYEGQARAMIESDELNSLIASLKKRGMEDKNSGLHVP